MARHSEPDPRTFYPSEAAETRAQARDQGAHWAAMVAGATEGLMEGLERYRIAQQASSALEEAGRLTRAVGGAGQKQAEDPVLRELGHDLQEVGRSTADASRHAAQASQEAAHDLQEQAVERYEEVRDTVVEQAQRFRDATVEKAEDLQNQARWKWMKVRQRSEDAADDVRIRARALGESGHRAAHAPRLVANDVKEGVRARMSGMGSSLAMTLAAGAIGLAAFVVLTIGVVDVLNAWLGAPWGTLLTAILYAGVAAGIMVAGKKAKDRAKQKSAARFEHAKEHVRDVGRPLRVAFAKDLEGYR